MIKCALIDCKKKIIPMVSKNAKKEKDTTISFHPNGRRIQACMPVLADTSLVTSPGPEEGVSRVLLKAGLLLGLSCLALKSNSSVWPTQSTMGDQGKIETDF